VAAKALLGIKDRLDSELVVKVDFLSDYMFGANRGLVIVICLLEFMMLCCCLCIVCYMYKRLNIDEPAHVRAANQVHAGAGDAG